MGSEFLGGYLGGSGRGLEARLTRKRFELVEAIKVESVRHKQRRYRGRLTEDGRLGKKWKVDPAEFTGPRS